MGTSPAVIATDPHVVSPRVSPGANGHDARGGAFKDILQGVPGIQDGSSAEGQTGTDSKDRIKKDTNDSSGQNDLLGSPVHLSIPFADQSTLPIAYAALGLQDGTGDLTVQENTEQPSTEPQALLIPQDAKGNSAGIQTTTLPNGWPLRPTIALSLDYTPPQTNDPSDPGAQPAARSHVVQRLTMDRWTASTKQAATPPPIASDASEIAAAAAVNFTLPVALIQPDPVVEQWQPEPTPEKHAESSSPKANLQDAAASIPETSNSFLARSENAAFALRLHDQTTPRESTSETIDPRGRTAWPSEIRYEPSLSRQPHEPNLMAEFGRSGALLWNEQALQSRGDLHSSTPFLELAQSSSADRTAAVHEIQTALDQQSKTNATNEILLHLGGRDQSIAAVRVMDRGGSVNVSVHASDHQLRDSLRSNLGELASELNAQGWKTDVIKPAIATERFEQTQDSRQDGQRSSGQQQTFTGEERQSAKDRRANNDEWLDTFEQENSGDQNNTGDKK
jgi:hypothetical protein